MIQSLPLCYYMLFLGVLSCSIHSSLQCYRRKSKKKTFKSFIDSSLREPKRSRLQDSSNRNILPGSPKTAICTSISSKKDSNVKKADLTRKLN